MKDFNIAKKICKESGVKGFRKLKLKRTVYVAGKQTVRVSKHIALRLIDRLKENGFTVDQEDVMRQLAEKDLFDSINIS